MATTLNSLARRCRARDGTTTPRRRCRRRWRSRAPRSAADHQLVAIYSINLAAEPRAGDAAAAEPLLREALRVRAHAPGIVPNRRRTFLEDDWSVDATQKLLDAAVAARAR